MIKTIPLTRGYVATVDPVDYENLSRFKWHAVVVARDVAYAVRTASVKTPSGGQAKRTVFMHREILGLEGGDGKEVDHVNGDGLDNRRSNLRVASRRENLRNRRSFAGSTSRYCGVGWRASRGVWRARITIEGREMSLGHFASEIEAALSYDEAARRWFGPYARLNFPDDIDEKWPGDVGTVPSPANLTRRLTVE